MRLRGLTRPEGAGPMACALRWAPGWRQGVSQGRVCWPPWCWPVGCCG